MSLPSTNFTLQVSLGGTASLWINPTVIRSSPSKPQVILLRSSASNTSSITCYGTRKTSRARWMSRMLKSPKSNATSINTIKLATTGLKRSMIGSLPILAAKISNRPRKPNSIPKHPARRSIAFRSCRFASITSKNNSNEPISIKLTSTKSHIDWPSAVCNLQISRTRSKNSSRIDPSLNPYLYNRQAKAT